jgi:hypothetical protein
MIRTFVVIYAMWLVCQGLLNPTTKRGALPLAFTVEVRPIMTTSDLTAMPSNLLSRPTTRALDVVAWLALYAQLLTGALAPDWSLRHLAEPVYLAVLANVASVAFITLVRVTGSRGSRAERTALALFLAGMPLIYASSWFLAPQPGWLGVELLGIAIFTAFAWLGSVRSPWFLALGILAHGLCWDLGHHDRTSFIPNWYTIGCGVTDVCVSFYAAVQVPWFGNSPGAGVLTRTGQDRGRVN